jgi:hypothetical protein
VKVEIRVAVNGGKRDPQAVRIKTGKGIDSGSRQRNQGLKIDDFWTAIVGGMKVATADAYRKVTGYSVTVSCDLIIAVGYAVCARTVSKIDKVLVIIPISNIE